MNFFEDNVEIVRFSPPLEIYTLIIAEFFGHVSEFFIERWWFPVSFSSIIFLNPCFLLRTGFEEDKSFHVVLNSVIAGRYHVTEYLGSAAFSKAIQAHDLQTGMDVCVKIIKNNKDFFDQSLDEIKLLKYINKHDPADKYHILRLYDYFYYRVSNFWMC